MTEVPTFQDLLAGFSDEIFVGRSEQLALFERALTAAKPPFLILAVSGQGGVGKTTLLEQFRHISNSHNVVTALANEDQLSVATTLAYFAKQFDDAGHPFKTFDERYRKYRELKQEMEADPKAPKGLLDFAVRSVSRIGIRSLKRVPVAGEIAEEFISEESENEIVDHVSSFASYVMQKFSNKDETVLLLETDAELTRHFIADLNEHAQKQRMILFFDTYEKTSPYLDTWLRDVLNGKFGKFSSRVFFIIAGRYPLGQSWTPFKGAVQHIELNEFTETEAQEYLIRIGINDEKQIGQLLTLSNRLPVLLALLASAPGEVPTEVSGTAVERFLQGATPEQREAALAASLPRRFNVDILEVVLGEEAAKPAFEWLSEAHFVRPQVDGWAYHEVVRVMMLRYFRLRSAQSYSELHERLAKYYQMQAANLKLPEKDCWTNEAWRSHEMERIYHNVSRYPSRGPQEVLNRLLLDPKNKEESEGLRYLRILAQTSEETAEPALKMWTQKFERFGPWILRIDSLNEEEKREILETITTICNWETLEIRSRSAALVLRGRVHRAMQNIEAALIDFGSAISLQPNEASNYHWRARCYLEAKNYISALADFDKAIELEPDKGFRYNWRGSCHFEAKDILTALTDFNKAIELQPDSISSFHWRARCHQQAKNFSAAVADFSVAIDLEPDKDSRYYWRGRCFFDNGDFDAALMDFERATELKPDAINHHWRARCHQQMKNYSAALADFDRAIELEPGKSFRYNRRGSCHFEAKNFSAALADFEKAIGLAPDDANNYHWRARCHQQMKNFSAALTDFEKAIELEPGKGFRYNWRGSCHFEAKNFSVALVDFDKAIDLAPDDANNYHWRARCYLKTKNYSAALADFDRAIELEPDKGFRYAWRGSCHLETKNFSSALADFDKAIELQPDDAIKYCWRGSCYLKDENFLAALVDFTKAIELAPDDTNSYRWRGRCYLKAKELQIALADLNKAIELLADNAYNHAWRGRVYLELGDTTNAQIDFNRVKSLQQDEGRPAYVVAAGYAKLAQLEEVCKWLRLAFERDKELIDEIKSDEEFDAARRTSEVQTLLQEFA